MSTSHFCEFCEKIIRTLRIGSPGYKSIKTNSFRESAVYCRLCELITAVDKDMGYETHKFTFPMDVVVFVLESHVDIEKHLITSFQIMSDSGSTPLEFDYRFSVWTREGEAAARTRITTQPPLFTNDPQEALPTINSWLQHCLSSHDSCYTTLSGSVLEKDVVSLPTRVLSVGSSTSEVVNLVESKGLQGRYCALSHCWGPPERNPLRTVKENLQNHLAGIPFLSLPRTFQEAVTITRGLGIDYLWIDSLCIVQDDLEEWLRESEVMGSLYQNATLMISASGSADSTGGCFIVKRSKQAILTVSDLNTNAQDSGRLHILPQPSGKRHPRHGYLAKRGWALQERFLSRRKVFFMPGGIRWGCKEFELDERSFYEDFWAFVFPSWTSFVREYTGMDITRPSDRLAAIQGVATEMSKSRNSRCLYGIWEDELLAQTLWGTLSRPKSGNELPGIPSWSWARTDGAKTWEYAWRSYSAGSRCKALNALSIVESRTLKVSGLLQTIAEVCTIKRCCVDVLLSSSGHYDSLESCPESRFFTDGVGTHVQSHLLKNEHGQILGIATFDMQAIPQPTFSFCASDDREPDDPWYHCPDKKASSGSRQLDTESVCSVSSVDTPDSWITICNEDDCVDLLETGRGNRVYWGYLLESVDDTLGQFRRVGLGLLYPVAWENRDSTIRVIEIV